MKRSHVLLAAAASLALLAAAPAASGPHEHGHPASLAELRFDEGGKQWPTDEALRQGMAALRGEVAAKRSAIRDGKMSPEAYAALGRTIEARVGDIVVQCKLDPRADAMLHVIVANLIAAADILQGKAPGTPASGVNKALSALNSYGRYFNDPQWTRTGPFLRP